MNGSAADSIRFTENESLTLVYADATKGWLAVEEGTGFVGETFIVATGGTITCSGDYKIHTFTSPGTFTVSQTASAPATNSIDYLVVAGGGGGSNQPPSPGQGGGAGGFRLSNSTCMPGPTTSPLANPTGIAATVAAFPITVGAAGGVDTKGSTWWFWYSNNKVQISIIMTSKIKVDNINKVSDDSNIIKKCGTTTISWVSC